MDRVLRNTKPKLRVELRDSEGNLISTDPGTEVTAEVFDSAGILVGAPIGAAPVSQGIYHVTAPALAMATPDQYKVLWRASIGGAVSFETAFEVVGGFIFGIQELREFDSALADTAKYPVVKVAAIRELAEEWIETLCGVAFRPRGRRASLSGNGGAMLVLPDFRPSKLLSATVDGVDLTAEQLAKVVLHRWGVAERINGAIWSEGTNNVIVHYEHGYLEAPEPVRRAAMIVAREHLVRRAEPDRAVSFTTEQGTFGLSVAGRTGPTGIPEVDSIVGQYSEVVPAIG